MPDKYPITPEIVAPKPPGEPLAPVKKSKLKLILLILLIISVITGVASWWWYQTNLKPQAPGKNELIRIDEGNSSAAIADELSQKGLIGHPWAFRAYLRLHGVSGRIQAGIYRIKSEMGVAEIARKLASGDTAVIQVTITGGKRLDQIVELLQQKGFTDEEIEESLVIKNYDYGVLRDKPAGASLEGYLFPDTYYIEEGKPLELLINAILANTDSKVTEEIRAAWAARGLNIHQGLTLASIVEKEVARPEDRRQVAQVYLKRLAEGMKLDADPTFEYAALLLDVPASTSVNSPYNTYLFAGLPPGPIAAPEETALTAVANPASTNWLYFLSDKDGNTHFSEDLTKHKENIEKYLQ